MIKLKTQNCGVFYFTDRVWKHIDSHENGLERFSLIELTSMAEYVITASGSLYKSRESLEKILDAALLD